MDRLIIVEMRRKTGDETVDRFRRAEREGLMSIPAAARPMETRGNWEKLGVRSGRLEHPQRCHHQNLNPNRS